MLPKSDRSQPKATPSRFIRLGSAGRLTGKDSSGSSGDGGEISGYTYKQSLDDIDS